MSDQERGVYSKFIVQRTDGSLKHQDCTYFVLDVNHDMFAVPALAAYAKACREEYPKLADDIELALASVNPALELKKLF
jgi:hypothetical protein